jgi:lipopolysaccharide/colanic/teichoic acid biosynthesis glycosyltransferase
VPRPGPAALAVPAAAAAPTLDHGLRCRPPTVYAARVTPTVRVLKRAIDISGALAGLALSLPLFPAIALAIRLDSPGPIFFRQRRAGQLLPPQAGQQYRFVEFDMFKFRSMRNDAEKHTGAVLATKGDPRVTRVGRFLRKTRLDELPQFVNVLKGDMSLIGPRPERPELMVNLALTIPFFEERMRGVKPGISGYAQVSLGYNGRPPEGSPVAAFAASLTNPFQLEGVDDSDADNMRMKLLYDLAYVASLEQLSTFLRTELWIIFNTPLVMLFGRGY